MAHLKRNRRGYEYDPTRPDPPLEERTHVVRLCEGGYYSKEHRWQVVPKSKATWFTRVDAERLRHYVAKEKFGFRDATIEEK